MSGARIVQKLYYVPKPSRWSRGVGAALPEEYKKFWREWKLQTPSPVHYVKQEESYVRNEETGEVKLVQNVPLPLIFPKEFHKTILGGEAIIQGFVKKGRLSTRIPHYWFPTLKQTVLYSEVLDKYMKTVVTQRTIDLINENYGFDHYLLKTQACDLKSELAVGLKRKILLALADKTLYPDNPEKQEEVYNKYKSYLSAYTREEIEWYGLSFKEACQKYLKQAQQKKKIQPLKIQYRAKFIEGLKYLQEKGYQIDSHTPVKDLAKAALEGEK